MVGVGWGVTDKISEDMQFINCLILYVVSLLLHCYRAPDKRGY